MKRLVAAAILLGFIATVYFTGNIYIRNVLDESYTLVNECTENYKNDKDPQKTAKKLQSYWTDNEGLLSVFAHHDSIDEVEKAIDTMVIYSTAENSAIFYEYSGAVETLLHQLYEDNSLTMHSVF